MKSGNLNFLEPSGPLQDCNRTVLPLPFLNDTRLEKTSVNYTTVTDELIIQVGIVYEISAVQGVCILQKAL
jgi:hypothetical protein